MKIIHISDTHGNHTELSLPPGDVLIHSGDFCKFGIDVEINAFLNWFRKQPFTHKILIGGNWDSDLAECQGIEELQFDLEGITYLCDDSVIIDGVKFFGSPKSPSEFGGAFTYHPQDSDWSMIPDDTDVLITHCPPKGILDDNLGCPKLAERISELDLNMHLFGHIHQAKGVQKINDTFYSNAAESVHALTV